MRSDELPPGLEDRLIERVRTFTRMRVGAGHRGELVRLARARAAAMNLPLATWALRLEGAGAGPELEAIVRELTVGETHLFRGPVFDVLRHAVLPDLVRRKRRDGSRTLRAASVGCATGEEAWSLAAYVTEAVAGEPGFIASVLGVDVNPAFLARAEEGVYARWSLRGVDPGSLEPWFEESGETWRVRPSLREVVRFQPLDLTRATLPSADVGLAGLDLVLCQNVLLYFERDARVEMAEGLVRCLAPGGLVFFGPSDLLGDALDGGTPEHWGPTSGRTHGHVTGHRRSEPSPTPARRESRPPSRARSSRPARATPRAVVKTAPAASYDHARALADAGSIREAIAELDRLLDAQHDHVAGHVLRGLLLTDAGDPDAALATFRKALYLDPGSLLALAGAIAAARKRGREDLVRRYAARLRALGEGAAEERAVEGWDGMTAGRLLQLARSKGAAG